MIPWCSFGIIKLNEEGKLILNFLMAYDFKIANTCFKIWEKCLMAYKIGVASSQIDFFLVWNMDKKIYKDCKVMPSEVFTTQHRILVLNVHVKSWT